MPIQPSAAILATSSYGKDLVRSSSSAAGPDLLDREVADGLLQELGVVVEVEVHGRGD